MLQTPHARLLQELGLEEVIELDDEQRQDPAFKRQPLQQRQSNDVSLGRDGCRVPMPWEPQGSSMGFGPEGGSSPWLQQPEEWRQLSVAVQESRDDSMLSIVRRAIAVRRACAPLLEGQFCWADEVEAAAATTAAAAADGSSSPLSQILAAAVSVGREVAGAARAALEWLIPSNADPDVLVFERNHKSAGRVVCVFNMVRRCLWLRAACGCFGVADNLIRATVTCSFRTGRLIDTIRVAAKHACRHTLITPSGHRFKRACAGGRRGIAAWKFDGVGQGPLRMEQ
jgi:glycosidase